MKSFKSSEPQVQQSTVFDLSVTANHFLDYRRSTMCIPAERHPDWIKQGSDSWFPLPARTINYVKVNNSSGPESKERPEMSAWKVKSQPRPDDAQRLPGPGVRLIADTHEKAGPKGRLSRIA